MNRNLPFCKNCKIQLQDYRSKRCQICMGIHYKGRIFSKITKDKMKLKAKIRWAGHIKKVSPQKSNKPKQNIVAKDHAEYMRLWRKLNPLKDSISKKGYKARKKGALGSHTWEEWKELVKFFNYMCLCCKKEAPKVILTEDHIIPLSKGGSDFIDNIQPLCRSCNTRKMTKEIDFRIPERSIFAIS